MRNEVLDDLSNLRYSQRYRVWKPFMEKYNCQIIAEIGIRKGINFNKLIKHKPKLAVAVDCWKDGILSTNDLAYSQDELDRQYEDFRNKFNLPFVKVLREYSFEAVKRFPNNYFDFVYIDADHTLEGCLRDIADWYPKVRKGGFLIGDDFKKHTTRTGVVFGVMEAVNKFTDDNKLSYFIFPRFKWGLVK